LDENDTNFQKKKRFVATQATKIEVSSPIRLQPKYEKKSPDDATDGSSNGAVVEDVFGCEDLAICAISNVQIFSAHHN
jgi:hypothetical protein